MRSGPLTVAIVVIAAAYCSGPATAGLVIGPGSTPRHRPAAAVAKVHRKIVLRPGLTTATPAPVCTLGPDCYPGPGFASYPDYGELGPDAIADCTFAAAANWARIVLDVAPNPSILETEFVVAGGTGGGLAQDVLWSYWSEPGIGGTLLSSATAVSLDRDSIQTAVRRSGAIIAQLQLSGSPLGRFVPTPGLHDLVVAGFTPLGPLVVSWGQTEQLTWRQWTAQAVGAWTVVARISATGTGTA